jgi:hypothetical protein
MSRHVRRLGPPGPFSSGAVGSPPAVVASRADTNRKRAAELTKELRQT